MIFRILSHALPIALGFFCVVFLRPLPTRGALLILTVTILAYTRGSAWLKIRNIMEPFLFSYGFGYRKDALLPVFT